MIDVFIKLEEEDFVILDIRGENDK